MSMNQIYVIRSTVRSFLYKFLHVQTTKALFVFVLDLENNYECLQMKFSPNSMKIFLCCWKRPQDDSEENNDEMLRKETAAARQVSGPLLKLASFLLP